MKLMYDEIADAIVSNQTKKVTEILDSLDLRKDGIPPCLTNASKEVSTTMLSFASVSAWQEALDDELAEELIERTAMAVNIFPFLRLVATAADVGPVNFNAIPKSLKRALRENDYSDKIARLIEDLDNITFETLITYILSGKIERTHVKFNLPIIRNIYFNELIPTHLLFAFMGLCPRETVDDHVHRVMHGGLGDLLFGLILDEMSEDEEEEDEEE